MRQVTAFLHHLMQVIATSPKHCLEFDPIQAITASPKPRLSFDPIQAIATSPKPHLSFDPIQAITTFRHLLPSFDPIQAITTFRHLLPSFDPIQAITTFRHLLPSFVRTRLYLSGVMFVARECVKTAVIGSRVRLRALVASFQMHARYLHVFRDLSTFTQTVSKFTRPHSRPPSARRVFQSTTVYPKRTKGRIFFS